MKYQVEENQSRSPKQKHTPTRFQASAACMRGLKLHRTQSTTGAENTTNNAPRNLTFGVHRRQSVGKEHHGTSTTPTSTTIAHGRDDAGISPPPHMSQDSTIGRLGRRLDTGLSFRLDAFAVDIPDTDAAATALGTPVAPPPPPPLGRTDRTLLSTLNMEAESDTSSPASIASPKNASHLMEKQSKC